MLRQFEQALFYEGGTSCWKIGISPGHCNLGMPEKKISLQKQCKVHVTRIL